MRSLGKILFSLLAMFQVILFADVKASFEQNSIEIGDMATLNLSITGKNIMRPQIQSLCNSDIVSTGSRTNIEMLNGTYSKSYILSYQFSPQKDCVIEPIEVEVDGVIEKSNSVSLKINPADATKTSPFILSLESGVKEVFVGEPFEVTLLFKQKSDAEAIDSKYLAPDFKGFWKKYESKPIQHKEGEYIVTKVTYKIAPQRAGQLTVVPAKMQIASRSNARDMFGMWMQNVNWKTYFSNEISVEVKPLPNGVDLVGNFAMHVSVDKNEINANEALNAVVTIQGEGNLEDIKTLKPYIDNVSIFDEKIDIQNSILNQKIAFVADANFTIPPFVIKYFDLKSKEIKTISTDAIPIKVNGAKVKKELTIKRQENIQMQEQEITTTNFSKFWVLIACIGGLASGIVLMIVKPWKRFIKEKEINIKDPKVLLMKLLPFKHEIEVQTMINILEKNLYSGGTKVLDKKELKVIMRKYNLS